MSETGIRGHSVVIDGEVHPAASFHPDMSLPTWYEVIRITDGKARFLSDHLERLSLSLIGSTRAGSSSGQPSPEALSSDIPSSETIRENLGLLLRQNQLREGNIRLCLQADSSGVLRLLCYFIPHHYPGERMYKEGISMLSFPYERPDPGIKKWNQDFRLQVNAFIREHDIYEALLTGPRGEALEGSRSNVFFVGEGNGLYTPPVSRVLPGITRTHLLRICEKLGLPVEERAIEAEHLADMQAAFISGTSPGVLPVRLLDGLELDPAHPMIGLLRKEYRQRVAEKLETII